MWLCLFGCGLMAQSTIRSCQAVNYLTTLVLGKLPRGSLPVYSAHSFATNLQFALHEQKIVLGTDYL